MNREPSNHEPLTMRDIGALLVTATPVGLVTALLGAAVGSLLGYLLQ